MQIDEDKIDDAVLALLQLTAFEDYGNTRSWKGLDRDALLRLHQKGYISDPRSKAKSVLLTEEGTARSERLFEEHFGR